MTTQGRSSSRLRAVSLMLALSFINLLSARLPAEAQTPASGAALSQQVNVRTDGGLRTTTFDTLHGRVIVHLPDDMRAGDTISGTVVAEPKGASEEERAKN